MSTEPLPEPPPQMLEPPVVLGSDDCPTLTKENVSSSNEECPNQQTTSNADTAEPKVLKAKSYTICSDKSDEMDAIIDRRDLDTETDPEAPLPEFDPNALILEDPERITDPNLEDDLLKCSRFASSQDANVRQQAARSLAQCLHDIGKDCTEEQMLMLRNVIEQLTHDSEPGVRLELLEHLSLLSGICLNLPEDMGAMNRMFLMPPPPVLVRLQQRRIIPSLAILMKDQMLQVRKTAHLILFRMLECRLILPPAIFKDILPTVLQLAKISIENADEESVMADFHDQRQEAATLLSKLIQFVEKGQAQTRLLRPFLKLCNDPSFHVRRACAVAMVNLCQVLDAKCIQNSLLATFLSLCDDDAWSVRKACTESFMAISCVVEPMVRLKALAPRFLCLLRDSAKWVVAAAYQNLGPFISTFADPKRTGLELLRPDGVVQEAAVRRTSDYRAPVYDKDTSALSRDVEFLSISESAFKALVTAASALGEEEGGNGNGNNNNNNNSSGVRSSSSSSNGAPELGPARDDHGPGETDVNFNSFLFWRSPLPAVEELAPAKKSDLRELLAVEGLDFAPASIQSLLEEERPVRSERLAQSLLDTDTSECGIPSLLLEHFKHMLEPTLSRTIDCLDLPRNCAYSLPAVALALGPKHWEEHLRELLLKLSINVQWKVRHSVASSLHSLVIIVGDRDSVKYIIPMFNTFCRDVDEIRLPLLRNLHEICAHLEPKSRLLLLHSLSEFTRSENDRMWRLRDELANQICLVAGYYKWAERLRYLLPILSKLLQDKVAQVRTSAAACFGRLIWSPYSASGARPAAAGSGSSGEESAKEGLPLRPAGSSSSSSRGISSPVEALDITLRLLHVDATWIKWQHRQAFARLLTSIVDEVPPDADILEGAEDAKVKRITADIGSVCRDCVGLRNIAVLNKLIRPEIFALLEHRVPNVRLEVANLMSKMVVRCAKILAKHKRTCEPCRKKVSDALQSVGDLRPPRRAHRRRKADLFHRAPVEDEWETDTEAAAPPAREKPDAEEVSKEDGSAEEGQPKEGQPKEAAEEPCCNERNSDSDSSQENEWKRCELLAVIGLTEVPAAFAILLDDIDEDVCRVAKEAINCFAREQNVP